MATEFLLSLLTAEGHGSTGEIDAINHRKSKQSNHESWQWTQISKAAYFVRMKVNLAFVMLYYRLTNRSFFYLCMGTKLVPVINTAFLCTQTNTWLSPENCRFDTVHKHYTVWELQGQHWKEIYNINLVQNIHTCSQTIKEMYHTQQMSTRLGNRTVNLNAVFTGRVCTPGCASCVTGWP